MNDTTRRLSQVTAWQQDRAFAAIAEAVWWVTMVDATLVRHHLVRQRDIVILRRGGAGRVTATA